MIFKDIFVNPKYPENLKKLYNLSQNLWCTWNYESINLFYRIEPQLFRKVNHNPVEFLLNLPKERIEELSHDKGFLFELDRVWDKYQEYINRSSVVDSKKYANSGYANDDVIAYFSMEYGLHECIPIYSGGLGILAGDFLKAASDLNLPMVGVGLLYKYGYFTQRVNLKGAQEELYVEFNNHLIPIHEVRTANNEKAYITIKMLRENVKIKLWQIDVGLAKLILLDTDIEDNSESMRSISYELYVSDREKRLQQEVILGIGGVKALEFINIKPKIYHINEGHSAFLVVARLQSLMKENHLNFSEAKAFIRASTVFTTHTPVIAGNENFETKLVRTYIEPILKSIDIPFDEFALNSFVDNDPDVFWLPALAIRFSKYINAVSKLHKDVSVKMWKNMFPNRDLCEVPIDYVTNGVHKSWLSEQYTNLLSRNVGSDFEACRDTKLVRDKITDLPDEEVWEAHRKSKQFLINFIRKKLADDILVRGYSQSKVMKLTHLLNPEYLLVVFSRRFAPYKRPALLLKDKERLQKILTDTRKPVQLIFAGKAHPADRPGKDMIKEIIDFAREYQLEDRVLFLENYDINVSRHLVCGADVWLNTPILEYEASGTSGMKAGMNGVLNLSVVDGWWPEGYNGRNGWAINAGQYYRHLELQEEAEANQIYNLLEDEITELYYERNEMGIPLAWVKMMKESMSSIFCKFNMTRVLLDYFNKFYVNSKKDIVSLSDNNFDNLRKSVSLEQQIAKCWYNINFINMWTNVDQKDYLVEGDEIEVKCSVNLCDLPTDLFSIEMFYMSDHGGYQIIPMDFVNREGNIANYQSKFKIAGYGVQNINARIRPSNPIIQDLHPEMIKWK
jgi:starch phosphorylase